MPRSSGVIHIRKCREKANEAAQDKQTKAELEPIYLVASELKGIKTILLIMLVTIAFGLLGQLIAILKTSLAVNAVGGGFPLFIISTLAFFLIIRIFGSASE